MFLDFQLPRHMDDVVKFIRLYILRCDIEDVAFDFRNTNRDKFNNIHQLIIHVSRIMWLDIEDTHAHFTLATL